MLGSDFPYFQDAKYKRSVDYIKESGIDSEKIDGILRGNAINLFNI